MTGYLVKRTFPGGLAILGNDDGINAVQQMRAADNGELRCNALH